jgi:hypothetical protein
MIDFLAELCRFIPAVSFILILHYAILITVFLYNGVGVIQTFKVYEEEVYR